MIDRAWPIPANEEVGVFPKFGTFFDRIVAFGVYFGVPLSVETTQVRLPSFGYRNQGSALH